MPARPQTHPTPHPRHVPSPSLGHTGSPQAICPLCFEHFQNGLKPLAPFAAGAETKIRAGADTSSSLTSLRREHGSSDGVRIGLPGRPGRLDDFLARNNLYTLLPHRHHRRRTIFDPTSTLCALGELLPPCKAGPAHPSCTLLRSALTSLPSCKIPSHIASSPLASLAGIEAALARPVLCLPTFRVWVGF